MSYITFQPKDYFNTKLYTGTGAENAISDIGFNPDWVWFKKRSASEHHFVYDQVRGALKKIAPSNTNAEGTETQTLKSFDTGGYTLGTSAEVNGSSTTYVAWNWKANGSGSANTDGDINSTVSANTTSGFSIVKYTGNGSSNQTVGHGLGVAPAVIMYKGIDAVHNWLVYHQSLGATQGIVLNLAGVAVTGSGYFDNTAPTSSVFSVSTTGGNDQNNVSSEDYIAYCFTEKKGFSKFGSYVANGSSDGNFIYLGFKPAFVLFKETTVARDWIMYDNKRLGYNPTQSQLKANDTDAEATDTTAPIDLCSNGFKLRGTKTWINESGQTYIYMAFAEHPLVSSNDIPSTAR